eukprot:5073280-Prymnesium_polylepis.1
MPSKISLSEPSTLSRDAGPSEFDWRLSPSRSCRSVSHRLAHWGSNQRLSGQKPASGGKCCRAGLVGSIPDVAYFASIPKLILTNRYANSMRDAVASTQPPQHIRFVCDFPLSAIDDAHAKEGGVRLGRYAVNRFANLCIHAAIVTRQLKLGRDALIKRQRTVECTNPCEASSSEREPVPQHTHASQQATCLLWGAT